jgi:NADPH2:quinone reductase
VHAAFETLLRWHADERIRPHVSELFPLAEARRALERLLARQSTGKIVLTVADTR